MALKKAGQRLDEDACDAYAEEKLQDRVGMIRSEMESVPGGRLEACVAVSQGDLIEHILQRPSDNC